MHIKRIEAQNYRTLEDFAIDFPLYYCAICGKNNSGKSNVLRAMRLFFGRDVRVPYVRDDDDFKHAEDFTAWKAHERNSSHIMAQLHVSLTTQADAGLIEFVTTLAGVEAKRHHDASQPNDLVVTLFSRPTPRGRTAEVRFNEKLLSDFPAQEIIKKLRTAPCIIDHSPLDLDAYYYSRFLGQGVFPNMDAESHERLGKRRDAFKKELDRCIGQTGKDLGQWLGRLGEKYSVKFSVPDLKFDDLPLGVQLGPKGYSIPLDDWGSGTRNQTILLHALFAAKNAAAAGVLSDRITPIVLIEEPESFLHPSAQAVFGRILQDISNEFKVQVIATTHSPYLLSFRKPDANILLERVSARNGNQEKTVRANIDGGNWTAPFAQALGIAGTGFEEFHAAIFNVSDALIMVEGETDADYLALCRSEAHGNKGLTKIGEIFAYGGFAHLQNTALLRFIRARFKRVVVTVDLDREGEVGRALEAVGFKRNVDFFTVGKDAPGKRCMEGLLPERVQQAVWANNVGLVQASHSDKKKEAEDAKQRLKRCYFEEFKKSATPGQDYADLYVLCQKIAKALG